LSTFRDAIRSYTLELNLQINDPRAILFGMPLGLDSTTNPSLTNAYDNRFDNFAVQITDMNLFVPAHKPNNEVRLMLKERDLAGFDYIRRYTDIEIVSSPYFDTSSGSTSFEITGLTRKPVAIIAGFQHIRDELSARGNIHRYFNPGVERSFIDIRGVQRFPQNGIERISGDNYGMFYQAFLKTFEVEHKMSNNDNLMTFKRFMNNKFLLCFDMTNSKIPRYDSLENNEVQFYASHSQMDAIADTVPGYKEYDAGANEIANDKYRVWFFCFVEKNLRITKGKDELLQVFDDYNID
jgi:hypothetical protein